jgi:hypothetical protein
MKAQVKRARRVDAQISALIEKAKRNTTSEAERLRRDMPELDVRIARTRNAQVLLHRHARHA